MQHNPPEHSVTGTIRRIVANGCAGGCEAGAPALSSVECREEMNHRNQLTQARPFLLDRAAGAARRVVFPVIQHSPVAAQPHGASVLLAPSSAV